MTLADFAAERKRPLPHPTPTDPARERLALAFLALAPLFWAGNAVVGRAVAGQIEPFTIVFLRWCIAFALFTPFGLPAAMRAWPAVRRHWRYLLLLATLGLSLFPTLLYTGLKTTTALNASFIQAFVPALIPVFAWLMSRERILARQAVGIAISVTGVVAIVSQGDPGVLLRLELVEGDAVMLLAACVWALYSLAVRRRPPELPANALHWLTMGMSAAVMLPLCALDFWQGASVPMTLPGLAAIAYFGIFPSLLSYMLYSRGVEIVGPTKGGLALNLVPVYGALLAVGFLGEEFRWYHALGVAMIFTGIYLVTRRQRSRGTPPEAAD